MHTYSWPIIFHSHPNFELDFSKLAEIGAWVGMYLRSFVATTVVVSAIHLIKTYKIAIIILGTNIKMR